MSADFADFDGDGRADLVYCPSASDQLYFYTNAGTRDAGGMPVFLPAGHVPRQTSRWEHMRAVDLDADGAMDIMLGSHWLRSRGPRNGLPDFAPIENLDAGNVSCVFDVDGDGQLDAIVLEEVEAAGLSNLRVAWRRNQGGDPPTFAAAEPLANINTRVDHPVDVAPVEDGPRTGLLVTQRHWQRTSFFRHAGRGSDFQLVGDAQSLSAVMGLGDQAWPCPCDWDGDGDLDLLVGGGYGWPRIVINEGTARRPAFAEPRRILAASQPIRFTRDELLGGHNSHNMGYPYPVFVDWDGDDLPDLVVPNETNRIFWYQNVGTRHEPRFAARRQIECEALPDSPAKRAQSAAVSEDASTPGNPYPTQENQAFFWRTGAAFADFNGDALMDFVTNDGHTRHATLFVQYRTDQGKLLLRKDGPLKLADGRVIDDSLIEGSRGWTESFRPVDWDGDGLTDLIYSLAGRPSGGSIHLLRNVGTRTSPRFAPPRAMRAFGALINITDHGPHPWAGDLDGDGLPDLLACVEWSVYPFFGHNALEMPNRPTFTTRSWATEQSASGSHD